MLSRGQKMAMMAIANSNQSKAIINNPAHYGNRENIGSQSNPDHSFKPTVVMETDSIQESENLYTTSENSVIHNDKEARIGESFDDSDLDPDYKPSSSSESDSEMNEIVGQIERNIESECENENLPSSSISVNENRPSTSKSAIRQDIKLKRNTGESYKTGEKMIKARECRPLEMCRKQCKSKVSFMEQNEIFKKFWSLGKYDLRILYASEMITVNPVKMKTIHNSAGKHKTRNYTYTYHFNINGKVIDVCQKCFRFTLGETDNFIKSVANKKLNASIPNSFFDSRGKSIPPNTLTADKITEIKNHIMSFPAYESHYSRKHTSQLYFQSDLTLVTMHKLYSECHQKPVSLSKYSQIFKGMNIKFKKPHLDVCNKCELFKAKLAVSPSEAAKLSLQIEQQAHHELVELGYTSKRTDKALCDSSDNCKVFTFDLQQCLPTPYMKTSVTFYKRPLWTFNLTVHDCVSSQTTCYMWHEGIGGRGGNEISSCLLEHIKQLPQKITSLIFHSDSCSGQNKNSFVATMFSIVSTNRNLSTVDHKFLVPGHTHMECDSDHAIIEKKKKITTAKIHHPRDWFQFVRTCGVKRKFIVNEMNQSKFFNFSTIAKTKFTWRKKNTDGENFYWQNVKWLRFTNGFGKIYYKCSFDKEEPFKVLNIAKRGVNHVSLNDIPLCYNEPLKISKEKKIDLISLLPLIDEEFHSFYQNLKSDEQIRNIDPDLDDDSSGDE